MLYKGRERDLNELIALLSSKYGLDVIGLRYNGGSFSYGKLSSINDAPLYVEDLQGRASYRLIRANAAGSFRHTYLSPKYFLNPPLQEVAHVGADFGASAPKERPKPFAIFGIKPCDLHAIRVIDGILLNKDLYYTMIRGSLRAVVVEECTRPSGNCFCGSLGTGPQARNGYDLAYAWLEDGVVVKAGSALGEELIEELGLEGADAGDVEKYEEYIIRAQQQTKALPELPKLVNALEKSMGNIELWSKLSRRCVGCSNCNMVCPTCFCTEFFDEIGPNGSATRFRKWYGCLSYSYGLVARGHFRPELYMRYRHFVLHKFLFYWKQVGLIGCTGCGRCITWCPLGVDIRETLREVFENAT